MLIRRLAGFSVSALALACASMPSHAITFGQLGADGSVVSYYTPNGADWQISTPAGTSLSAVSGGWNISLGTAEFGIAESGNQSSAVYGAGLLLPGSAYGWQVDFSANLRTWDSYNDGSIVPPNPGGSLGYWDLFSVNLNTQNYYWNLVSPSASAPLSDPLLPLTVAGSVVTYNNANNAAGVLAGNTWAWGGRDYAAGYFESVTANGAVSLATTQQVYVSFSLDTATAPNNDSSFPSWGSFGVSGQSTSVPDGQSGEGPGGSAANPLMPVEFSNGSYEFAPVQLEEGGIGIDQFLFIDPDVAIAYDLEVSGGPSFVALLLPTLGDANGYTIETFDHGVWSVLGHVADGGTYSFVNALTEFRIGDIDPALGLDPNNPVAFVLGAKFDGPGVATLAMTPITANITAAVPEPETYALMLMGLAGMGAVVRRRRAA